MAYTKKIYQKHSICHNYKYHWALDNEKESPFLNFLLPKKGKFYVIKSITAVLTFQMSKINHS
jgi:hypothetical protein